MRNIIQKEGQLFLNHNLELYLNKHLILNNICQITKNYALTTDGRIYKIKKYLI